MRRRSRLLGVDCKRGDQMAAVVTAATRRAREASATRLCVADVFAHNRRALQTLHVGELLGCKLQFAFYWNIRIVFNR